ncbi:hypothetical protein LAZ67_5002192 [Cordylochernes scorpioides]|uniref:Uncharacterized protein n=1 Tax=Cordylochernes scorpioides TaxID=51811 RepID=A0ABY6KGX7_9ARAC|nr:hypothetical protein LAZ67_5002192 [Cordylochernes scorpioides]
MKVTNKQRGKGSLDGDKDQTTPYPRPTGVYDNEFNPPVNRWPDVINNPAPDRWRDFTGTNQGSPPYAGKRRRYTVGSLTPIRDVGIRGARGLSAFVRGLPLPSWSYHLDLPLSLAVPVRESHHAPTTTTAQDEELMPRVEEQSYVVYSKQAAVARGWTDAYHQRRLFNRKDPIDKVKSFSFTTTLGRMLHKSSKPPFKSSNGKLYSTRRTLRILHQPITTFSAPCQTI